MNQESAFKHFTGMATTTRARITPMRLLGMALGAATTLFVSGCETVNEAATKAAASFQDAMQNTHDSANGLQTSYSVRGRVRLKDGQTLTCFDGIPTGYLGAPNMTKPGDGSYDPKSGTVTLKTSAIPTVVMTANGTVISNNCDKLAAEGVLVVDAGNLRNSSNASAFPAEPKKGDLVARTTMSGVPVTIWTPDCKDFFRKDGNGPTRHIYPGSDAAIKLDAACTERNYKNTHISVEK